MDSGLQVLNRRLLIIDYEFSIVDYETSIVDLNCESYKLQISYFIISCFNFATIATTEVSIVSSGLV